METKHCNGCKITKSLDDFYDFKKNNREYKTSQCKECRKAKSRKWHSENKLHVCERSKSWRLANLEKAAESSREWAKNNKDRLLTRVTKWQKENPEKVSKFKKNYRENNIEYYVAKCAERRAKKLMAKPLWANDFIINEAYSLARLRTKMFGYKWNVDHIVPLQSRLVCGLHCEANFRVIPATANIAKRNRHWPEMP